MTVSLGGKTEEAKTILRTFFFGYKPFTTVGVISFDISNRDLNKRTLC